MVNERIDEEIGALLDGRVDEGRRGELLARLAADGDDYDVFADTAAVLREAEEGATENVTRHEPETVASTPANTPTKVIPLRPRAAVGWRSPAVRTLAAAAAVLVLALVPVARLRMNAGAWRDPQRMAHLASPSGAPLPAGWEPAWGATRGIGGVASDSGIAARIGALDVDARVAAASGDTAAVADYARQIANLAGDISGGGSVALAYRAIAGAPSAPGTPLEERLDSARDQAELFLDRDYLALGGWAEAARLAAAHRNAAFFHTSDTRNALEHAAALPDRSDARAAAGRIRFLGDQGAVRDWTALQRDLKELLRGLAR